MRDYCKYSLLFAFRIIPFTLKCKITFSDDIDPDVLYESVNYVFSKHEYLRKKVVRRKNEFIYVDNNLPILVLPYSHKARCLNTKETNYNLVFAEYEGKDLYLSFSHTVVSGLNFKYMVFDLIADYVNRKYSVNIPGNDPSIYEKENIEPDVDKISCDYSFPNRSKKAKVTMPYMEHLFGYLRRKQPRSEFYEFNSKDLMKIIKSVDGSPASFFSVLSFKTYSKVHKHHKKPIGNFIFHNPMIGTDYQQYHGHFTFGPTVIYPKNCYDYDLEKLNLMTRGNIIFQSDLYYSKQNIANIYNFLDSIDKKRTLFGKQLRYTISHPTEGALGMRFSNSVSYSGQIVAPELEKYVQSYFFIVGAHLIYELSALNDKIFLSLNLLTKHNKYVNAFEEVLKELNIPYKKICSQEKYMPRLKIKERG